jgi:hypothetical protein
MVDADVSPRQETDPSRVRAALANATWIAFLLMAASSLVGCAVFVLWGAAWMVGIV